MVGGTEAYAEDSWHSVRVGAVPAAATLATGAAAAALQWPAVAGGEVAAAVAPGVELEGVGPCVRCDVVCADPWGTGRWVGVLFRASCAI